MKRALSQLQEDELARQEDDLLRAQLEREEIAEQKAKKKRIREEKFVEKWRSHMQKWNEMGLVALGLRSLTLPAPARLSTLFCLLVGIILFFGATVDLAALGRAATELDCLHALLPSSTWALLLAAANASLAIKQTSPECGSPRHYRPSTREEMQCVFFARLDLISRAAPGIHEGFEVRPPPLPSSLPHPTGLS
jgi:hypothetical protein